MFENIQYMILYYTFQRYQITLTIEGIYSNCLLCQGYYQELRNLQSMTILITYTSMTVYILRK